MCSGEVGCSGEEDSQVADVLCILAMNFFKLLANSLGNRLRRLVAAADRCMERLEIGVVEFRRNFLENPGLADLLHRKSFTTKGLSEILVAILDCVFASFSRMPSLDLVRGQPVPRDLSSPQGDLVQEVRYRDAIQRL